MKLLGGAAVLVVSAILAACDSAGIVDRETGQPSAQATIAGRIDRTLCVGEPPVPTLSSVAIRIEDAIKDAGLGEPRVFDVDDGFAIATQNVEIGKDGKPAVAWVPSWFPISPPEGPISRTILFVITKSSLTNGTDKVPVAVLESMVDKGHLSARNTEVDKPLAEAHQCLGFVYLYYVENINDELDPKLLNSRESRELLGFSKISDHLRLSGLTAKLKKQDRGSR